MAAIIALAVGLWPSPGAQFDPGKAATFIAALAAWLYAELFTDEPRLDAHDQELAARVYAIMGDADVKFLQDHDFGGSWLKRDLDPVYSLAHLAESVNAEFNNSKLQAKFESLRGTVRRFAAMMAHGASPFGTGPSPDTMMFSMIPDQEHASEEWSERTNTRVKEANDLATELADELATFYRLLRKRGANLLANRLDG
ncbi:MAG: hypothetical protein ACJ8FO_01940 [Sphingomicrobium sp.]